MIVCRKKWIVGLLFLYLAAAAQAQPTFEISPPNVLLGQFCAVDITENAWGVGETEARIFTEVPWSLTAQLMTPILRVMDGLELPAERARELFPDVGEEFANYLPFELDYGPRSEELQVLRYEWQVLQLRLEQALVPEDPPGIYSAEVSIQLLDRDGNFLADRQLVIFEFEILPWIEIELASEFVMLSVTTQREYAESDPLPVRIRSNAAWEMRLLCSADFYEVGGEGVIPRDLVAWVIPPGENWESLIPEYLEVGDESVLAVRGAEPAVFTVSDVEIPVLLRCGPMGIWDEGEYTADIVVTAQVEISTQ